LALVPAVLSPPLIVVTILAGLSGFAIGAAAPIANGQFVQALPDAYRARAFGVVQAGLNLLQGGAVLLTGLLARSASVPVVVGLWSLAGVGLMLMLAVTWPSQRTFAAAAQAPTTAHAQPATSPATPRVRRAARHAAGSTTAEVPEAL
jgi:MFS family permease